MQIALDGVRAVVTGSTQGIGFGIARGLAKAGAYVVLTGRTQEKVEAAVLRLRGDVGDAEVIGVAGNLATAEGVDALVRKVPTTDILINNVATYPIKSFFDITDEDWQQTFDLNVMSGVRLVRAYAPAMMAKHWGRIVFISSEAAINVPADMLSYGTSKAALHGLTVGLGSMLGPSGVTVNAVVPATTRTEGAINVLQPLADAQGLSCDELFSSLRPSSMIKRLTNVEEVVSMVVYVCSREASATTGACLRVDGGVIHSII